MGISVPQPRRKLKTVTEDGLLSVVVISPTSTKTHYSTVGSISLVASQTTREMFLKDMVVLAMSTTENLDVAENLLRFTLKTGSKMTA